jgi:hypothetical protein
MIRFMAILLQVASGASVSNSNSVPGAGISMQQFAASAVTVGGNF